MLLWFNPPPTRVIQCLIPLQKLIKNGRLANRDIAPLDFQHMLKCPRCMPWCKKITTPPTFSPILTIIHSLNFWCRNNQTHSWGTVTAHPLFYPLLVHHLLSLFFTPSSSLSGECGDYWLCGWWCSNFKHQRWHFCFMCPLPVCCTHLARWCLIHCSLWCRAENSDCESKGKATIKK